VEVGSGRSSLDAVLVLNVHDGAAGAARAGNDSDLSTVEEITVGLGDSVVDATTVESVLELDERSTIKDGALLGAVADLDGDTLTTVLLRVGTDGGLLPDGAVLAGGELDDRVSSGRMKPSKGKSYDVELRVAVVGDGDLANGLDRGSESGNGAGDEDGGTHVD
jgi:hypothetical protein